jgi:nucleotide-binding universal stress UspA family protein
MKKILVPCDFSKQSNKAYKVALDIATKTKGEIVLLHVIAISNPYTTGFAGEPHAFAPQYFAQVEEDIKSELVKMQKKASDKSVKTIHEITYGDLTVSAKNFTQSHKIDLVVMGTSDASCFTGIFTGFNTEKVVRFSPVPVLAVRKTIDLKMIKNILLPSTLDLNQADFINKLKELQMFFDATLHILHVNTPVHFKRDAAANEALKEFAKHYKLMNYKLHFSNSQHGGGGIIDFACSQKMDLIAMATHARKNLAHLFNASVTESVVNHIQSPIWTYCIKG